MSVLTASYRPLQASDLVDGFDAGPAKHEKKLTLFLRRHALRNQLENRSRTFVADVNGQIVAYVTLAPGGMEPEHAQTMDPAHPKYPAPVLILARMATHVSFQKQGFGKALLTQIVIPRAQQLAAEHGCFGVFADAEPTALTFYTGNGFTQLEAQPSKFGNYPVCRRL